MQQDLGVACDAIASLKTRKRMGQHHEEKAGKFHAASVASRGDDLHSKF